MHITASPTRSVQILASAGEKASELQDLATAKKEAAAASCTKVAPAGRCRGPVDDIADSDMQC